MIMVMGIIHVGDLKLHVISTVQIRRYVTGGALSEQISLNVAECVAHRSGDRPAISSRHSDVFHCVVCEQNWIQ